MPTLHPVNFGSYLDNCWPADPQTLLNNISATVSLSITGIIVQAAEPDATDRDKLWIKLNGSSYPSGRFLYANGKWVWPHPVPPSDKSVIMFTGSSGEVDTKDGGTAGTATITTGPFWEIKSEFAQRMPIGVGTLPDTSTAINVGDDGGAETHTLTNAQLPEVNVLWHGANANENLGNDAYSSANGDDYSLMTQGAGIPRIAVQDGKVVSLVGANDEAHNNMPPYHTVYFIGRTIRQFYTG